ncbi:MAG TPA: phosphate-starvation-inducible PsiE family protein [Gammaproteobacteria bacterium]|nr:phosphate-starvation-inducible PsiE family protein [Gammaproteobacteria bacterium]
MAKRNTGAGRSPRALILRLYDGAIDSIVIVLVLVMLVTLGFATYEVLLNVIRLVPTFGTVGVGEPQFRELVGNVLNVFIVIELFSTFAVYIRTHRIRLSILTDLTIVFLLRELLIKVYAQSRDAGQLYTLAVVLLILIVARTILARLPPTERARDE